MKTHGKRFFAFLLAAALVLPVFCALPASASSSCNHVFGQYKLVGTKWETSSSGHTLVETSYPVCSVCGWINSGDPKVTRTPGSHNWGSDKFSRSTHTGKYINHTWTYQHICETCRYIGYYTTSSGCNANGCALDPMSIAPEIK